ncbi:MAG TPA: AMED_5909 family protein, partial [Pseudonocardiaceae bacterium]|nr:AMED_5909 family protein [Pseudonocardiaceae bacterium]
PRAGPGRDPGAATAKLTAPVASAVTTLRDAHDLIRRLRPASDAPVAEWLAFRRRAAQIYTTVADADRYHHHEALYWVQREREAADELAAQIRASGREPDLPSRPAPGRVQ